MNDTSRITRRQPRPPLPTARAAAVVFATAGLALVVAACGGSPSSAGPGGSTNAGGSTTAQSTNSQKALAFAHCMRSEGVPDFPDPDGGGQFDKTTLQHVADSTSRYQAAAHGCQHLLPTASAAQRRNDATLALHFSQCMRAHGITNFPDPGSDGRIPDSFGIDQGSTQFQAANQACGRYRPPYIPSNAAYNAYARAQGS